MDPTIAFMASSTGLMAAVARQAEWSQVPADSIFMVCGADQAGVHFRTTRAFAARRCYINCLNPRELSQLPSGGRLADIMCQVTYAQGV
jgi:hypothetical protein